MRLVHPGWHERATCVVEERPIGLFFATDHESPYERALREHKASQVCARCPVMVECRAAARRRNEIGYWGGENDEQRALATGRIPLSLNGDRRARIARILIEAAS